MESTESRIAPSPGAASDDSASPLNRHPEAAEPAGQASPGGSGAEGGGAGEPLDRLAFEPVPLRYRADGLTPEKQRAYVEALADTGIARAAAARVGLSEQAINRVRRRADARSFDEACEAAHRFGARRLRSIAWERAVEGTLKGRYYHGERIGEERVYDNRLLVYLLGKTEHLLARDEKKSRTICDDWEAHMDALEQGLPPPGSKAATDPGEREFSGHEVREDDEGQWWTSFPPPAGFDGEERGRFGEDAYERTLSAREQALLDAQLDEEDAEYRASETARRDRFFGFAGDEISSPREAEPCETSEPSDPDARPIEYKSAFPLAEARRRGGPPASPQDFGRARRAAEPFPAPAHSLDKRATGGTPWPTRTPRPPRRRRCPASRRCSTGPG